MQDLPIRRALISVSDKSGLVEFAKELQALGVELISTGGTRQALVAAGLAVTDISAVTGFPEILDGRVKTLHPHIHAAILARRDVPEHLATLDRLGISPIDLVVSNLYPFERTVATPGMSPLEILETIDIGGPTLVRAAAKNFAGVGIVSSPDQYGLVAAELRSIGGKLRLATRQRLAAAAFAHIAAYDQAIAAYFADGTETAGFPQVLRLTLERRAVLRYGENPHQRAAFYVEPGVVGPGVGTAKVLHGKELSYNNILDLDSALRLVREFRAPAAVIIKHNNPCGAARAATLAQAFQDALDADPVSAFGGILGFNQVLDLETARRIAEPNRFVEAIVAPGFHPEAFAHLTTQPKWRDSVRLLEAGPLTEPAETLERRQVEGGFLVQTSDVADVDWQAVKVVTQRAPTTEEWDSLRFAWLIAKHVKSNAIVLAHGTATVGVGAGQMSRVESVNIALRKAGDRAKGSVLASDGFFPFRDSIDLAADAGVTAFVQPGGSVRDSECIRACDERGLAMVCTGMRHFRH